MAAPKGGKNRYDFSSFVNKIAYQASDWSYGIFHKLEKSYDQWDSFSSKRDNFYSVGSH